MSCNTLKNTDTGTESNTSSVDNPACKSNNFENIPLPRERLVCPAIQPLFGSEKFYSEKKETKKELYSRLSKQNNPISFNKMLKNCAQDYKTVIKTGICKINDRCVNKDEQ